MDANFNPTDTIQARWAFWAEAAEFKEVKQEWDTGCRASVIAERCWQVMGSSRLGDPHNLSEKLWPPRFCAVWVELGPAFWRIFFARIFWTKYAHLLFSDFFCKCMSLHVYLLTRCSKIQLECATEAYLTCNLVSLWQINRNASSHKRAYTSIT